MCRGGNVSPLELPSEEWRWPRLWPGSPCAHTCTRARTCNSSIYTYIRNLNHSTFFSVLFCIAHILHYWTTTASLCVMHSGGDYLMHENLRGLNTFLCSSCMKTSLYLCYRNVSNYSKFLYFDENRNHCSASTRMTSLICGTDSCCWNLPNIISMQWKTERESSLYCLELEANVSQKENLAKWNQNYLFGWKTLKVGLGSQLFFMVTHRGMYMQHQVEYKCIGIIKTHGVHLLWT